MFCLPQSVVNEFKAKLKSGEIDPMKLADMTSAERRSFFSTFLGDANARSVNALFESKLLLKNQQQGFINWAKKTAGLSKEARKDIVSRINRMDKILEPREMEAFLEDLASQKLGFDVTMEEAAKISQMAKDVAESKIKAENIINDPAFNLKTESKASHITRLEYGLKLEMFKDYVKNAKLGGETPIWRDFLDAAKDPARLPIFIGNVAKSLKASFDNSFFLNQGSNALFDPKTTKIWAKAFAKSFKNIAVALKGGDPILGVRAEISSRPNAMNGTYERMKLATGLVTEEAIPTTIGEKIPVLGRFFKASNSAYNAAALEIRADIADMKIAQFEKNGINLKDKFEAESLGKTINSFTGRGDTGRLTGENINALVFSLKFAKSKFDVMTAHLFSPTVSKAAKVDAAYGLLRLIGTSMTTMMIANTLFPDSTSFDPRDTNFGKIRVGNTWYPTPLSFGGLPNVIARTLIPTKHDGEWGLWMKTSSGKWKALMRWEDGMIPVPTKYGATTAKDVAEGYIEGKASPIIKALLEIWNGKDFNDNPSTLGNILKNLVIPISPDSIIRASKNDEESYKLFNYFMTLLGSSSSTPKAPVGEASQPR